MAKEEKETSHCLYIKFKRSLNKDKQILKEQLQKMCPLVVDIRRPRQPNSKFCFVHFHSKQDLLKGKEILENTTIFNQKIIIQIPTRCNEEQLAKKKTEVQERRSSKKSLKALERKSKANTSG